MSDYKNSVIYLIKNNVDKDLVYIGSTKNKKRRCNFSHEAIHKYFKNSDNCYFETYLEYSCDSEKELRKKEGEVIKLFTENPDYNVLNRRKEYGRDYSDRKCIICECGCKYTPHNAFHILRHQKSKKHQKYLDEYKKYIEDLSAEKQTQDDD